MLKQDDIGTTLLPAVASFMNNMLQNDPKSPIGKFFDTGGTLNPNGTTAQAGDGLIGLSELITKPLISSLMAPGVQIWDAIGENDAPSPLGEKKGSYRSVSAFPPQRRRIDAWTEAINLSD